MRLEVHPAPQPGRSRTTSLPPRLPQISRHISHHGTCKPLILATVPLWHIWMAMFTSSVLYVTLLTAESFRVISRRAHASPCLQCDIRQKHEEASTATFTCICVYRSCSAIAKTSVTFSVPPLSSFQTSFAYRKEPNTSPQEWRVHIRRTWHSANVNSKCEGTTVW
jgi:hypothetical protein